MRFVVRLKIVRKREEETVDDLKGARDFRTSEGKTNLAPSPSPRVKLD
jgi:hypothetical protein